MNTPYLPNSTQLKAADDYTVKPC